MKIEKQGVRITDVRGVESIEVHPSGRVTVRFTGADSQLWEPEPLGEFIEALKVAHTEALAMTGQSAPQTVPRVFSVDTGIPDDVTRVRDVDGDEWARNAEGRWDDVTLGPTYGGYSSDRLLRNYGPLIEVLP